MWLDKRAWCTVLPALLLVAAAAGADPAPSPPPISSLDQRFLVRLIRQAVEQRLRDESVYEVGYVPPSLRGLECQAVVTLRQHGYVRGLGTGLRGPVAVACRDAALAALTDAAKTGPVTLSWLDRVRIDVEAVGDPVPFEFPGRWTEERAFNPYIEPGVHGVLLRYGQAHRQFTPSQIVTQNITVHEAIRALAQQFAQTPEQLVDATVARFRSTHFLERSPGGDVIELRRGLVLVEPGQVTDAALADTIERLAQYMIYRQLPSGLFSYQYEPSVERYTDDDNPVRQAGAAWALAWHAREYERTASAAAASKAIDRLASRAVDLESVEDAAYIAAPDGRHKLGITALTALAMYSHPDGPQYAELRGKLVNGVRWLQTPSGMFVTAFPPASKFSSQYYFPGEALLVLARDYEHQPGEPVVEAFDRAYDYYHRLFADDPTPPFAAWHTQAFARMAAPTKRRDYVDFVFEMTDWLVDKQYDETNCPWPELHGGVQANVQGRVGVATASYLEGFAEALRLARRVGDDARTARYERAVRLAARFVMQLQVRPEEAYYVRSPQDTVGGIRTSPTDNRLRIDHCQHALLGLARARQVLFAEAR